MKTVERIVVDEFHYAMDGINPKRWPVGSLAEVKVEDVDRLISEGKLSPDDADTQKPKRRKRK